MTFLKGVSIGGTPCDTSCGGTPCPDLVCANKPGGSEFVFYGDSAYVDSVAQWKVLQSYPPAVFNTISQLNGVTYPDGATGLSKRNDNKSFSPATPSDKNGCIQVKFWWSGNVANITVPGFCVEDPRGLGYSSTATYLPFVVKVSAEVWIQGVLQSSALVSIDGSTMKSNVNPTGVPGSGDSVGTAHIMGLYFPPGFNPSTDLVLKLTHVSTTWADMPVGTSYMYANCRIYYYKGYYYPTPPP